MTKWIICDLDGTLLAHNDESYFVDENTINLINRIIANNKIKFTIATGRHYLDVKLILEKFKIRTSTNSFIIGMNGAQIYSYNQDKLIKEQYVEKINQDCIKKIDLLLKTTLKNKYVFMGYGAPNKIFFINSEFNDEKSTQNLVDQFMKYEGLDKKYFDIYVSDRLDTKIKIYKMIIFIDEVFDYEKLKSELLKINNNVAYVRTDDRFIEIINHNTDKLNAISFINKNYMNCKKDDVMVFGDSFNDLEMLKWAGTSITRSSANEKIKEVCSYVINAPASTFVGDAIEMLINIK